MAALPSTIKVAICARNLEVKNQNISSRDCGVPQAIAATFHKSLQNRNLQAAQKGEQIANLARREGGPVRVAEC